MNAVTFRLRAYFKMKISRTLWVISLLLLGGVLLLPEAGWAVDANFNTQSSNLRSNGSDGNPGFDPCAGGTNTNGVCGGAATGLLAPANLTTLFPSLGPGAITGNMFGLIANKNAVGTTMDTTRCSAIGSNSTTSSAALASPAGFQPGLDCGDIHFDPTTQGQTIPAGVNTLVVGVPVVMNNSLVGDFCALGATDCDPDGAGPLTQVLAAHTGFNFANNFTFTPLAGGVTATSLSSQVMHQVTGVKTTGIGTFAAPGTGDQDVRITSDFTFTSPNTVAPTGGLVTWTQSISDPDQSGLGTGKFTQSISGSFTYNAIAAFPVTQYPFGQSQTNGDIASAQLP